MQVSDFLDLMAVDKKVVNGHLRLILLQGELGNSVLTADFDRKILVDLLESYCTATSR